MDQEFHPCLSYWLGLRLSQEGSSCPVCKDSADSFGDHQVGCGGNGDRIHRHDAIQDVLFATAQSAALAPRMETPSLIPSSRSPPADVFLPNWKRGQPAALDITVISSLQKETISGAANSPGYALNVRKEQLTMQLR